MSSRAPTLVVVIVEDRVDENLIGHGGCRYIAPPQPIAESRNLVRLVLGRAPAPADWGPWRRAVAGGQRIVAWQDFTDHGDDGDPAELRNPACREARSGPVGTPHTETPDPATFAMSSSCLLPDPSTNGG
jgi:hypothetical protein